MSQIPHRAARSFRAFAACLCASAALFACGGGDGAPPPSEGQATITAEGGTVAGPDGVTLAIPAGAAPEGTTFRIARSSTGAPDLQGITLVTPLYEVTPHGTQFAASTLLRLPFDAAALPAGSQPLVLRGEPDGRWHVGAARLSGDGAALVDVNELSWYAIGVCTPGTGGIFGVGDCPTNHQLKLEYLDGSGVPFAVPRSATGLAQTFLPEITAPTDVVLRYTWTRPAGVDRSDLVLLRSPGTQYFALDVNQQVFVRDQVVHIDPTQTGGAAGPQGVVKRFYANAEYCWVGFIVGRGPDQSVCWDFDTDIALRVHDTRAAPDTPVITLPPQDRDVPVLDPVSFTVWATAADALRVTWQRWNPATSSWADAGNQTIFPSGGSVTGSVLPSGASPGASTFTIPSVSPANDQGARLRAHVCNTRVTGSSVCVDSAEALLGVNTNLSAPQITLQPVSRSIASGQTFDVTVAASGVPAPTIEIHSSTGGIVKTCYGPGRNAPATSCTHTTAALARADSGTEFWGVASIDAAHNYIATSQHAVVTVVDVSAPSIGAADPADVAVSEGSPAVFGVNAGGTAPLSYQWSRNGVDIVGANGSSYTLAAAQLGDNGALFRVVVSNGSGSASSRSALLSVSAAAAATAITSQPASATVAIGGTATFGVVATGTAPLSYDWQSSVDNGSTWNSIAGADSSSYTTPAVAAGDDGTQFRVRVVNGAGLQVVSLPALLRVGTAGGPVVRSLAGLASQFSGHADGTGSAAMFHAPSDLVLDATGNVYVAEQNTVRKITPAGVVSTIAGTDGENVAVDGTGAGAHFTALTCIGIEPSGNLLVCDTNAIRRVTPGGVVTTVAGSVLSYGTANGVGMEARFNQPTSVVADAQGNIYVVDQGTYQNRPIDLPDGSVRRIAPDRSVTTISLPHELSTPSSVALLADGRLVIADRGNNRIVTLPTTGGSVTLLAGRSGAGGAGFIDDTAGGAAFSNPWGVTVDATGTIYVADEVNGAVRRVTLAGEVTTTLRGFGLHKLAATRGPGGALRLYALAYLFGAPAWVSTIDP